MKYAICLLLLLSCSKPKAPVETAPVPAPVVVEAPVAKPAPAITHRAPYTCSNDTCTRYFPLWKSMVLKRGKLTQEWFDDHITPDDFHTSAWNAGESLTVRYKVSIDWADAINNDSFLIKLNQAGAPYMSDAEIEANIAADRLQVAVSAISPEPLKYASQAEALAVMRAFPEASTLEAKAITYMRPGMRPTPGMKERENGHLQLSAHGVVSDNDNRCVKGLLDLVTGEVDVHTDACRVF